MLDKSDGPVIPERTSARTSFSASKERRRRSLPLAAHRNDKRRGSNHVHVKPASTEVISSLIETLSAISSPAEHHFDSLPNISVSHSTPVSPAPWRSEFPTVSEPTSRNMREDVRLSIPRRPHGVDAAFLLHPDHASTRTSSPGRSSNNDLFRAGPREPADPCDLGDIYSIGNVSIEPKPEESTTSVNSVHSDAPRSLRSIRSIKSLKSLKFMSSRDSLRSGDEKVVHKPKSRREKTRERLVIGETPPSSPPLDQITVFKRAARNSGVYEPPNVSDRASSVRSNTTPRRLYWNAEDATGETNDTKSPYNIPHQDYIPTRESSKRHSIGRSSAQRKRQSRQSDHSSIQHSRTVSVEDTPQQSLQKVLDEPEPQRTPEPTPSIEPTEDLVTRRIRELKDQKLQRERFSLEFSPGLESPSEFFSAPQSPDGSFTPCPVPPMQQPPITPTPEVKQRSVALEDKGQEVKADVEKSAPSPAIAQRTMRNNVGSRPNLTRDRTTIENKRRSFSLPQRTNSRLLKRLSRPTSPLGADRHTRTFSTSSIQEKRDTFYQTDRDGDSIDDAVDDYLSSPRLNQRIKHSQTGRVISFSEVGDPKGSTVFCCVGMGLTRFLTAFYDELALTLKLRLITPDRPGVGGSELHADGTDTPLGWPDDVRAICEHLKITKFSIMAHSAGAIYALATALRMSQHIRCRVHLLAPWIPPSQMSVIGAQQDPLPTSSLPYSQRILRALPTTFLRAANSSFLSTTSASITTSLPKSPRRTKQRGTRPEALAPDSQEPTKPRLQNTSSSYNIRKSEIDPDAMKENKPPNISSPANGNPTSYLANEKQRSSSYESRLTEAIWSAATTSANPAVDLLVCLERRQPIGFRYVDITRAVVIHHGSKDTRVPVENVKWLGKTMRRCEVRVLEGEGHGLMASAGVMGNVLMEMAQEWDDWNRVVRGKGGNERRVTNAV